LDLADDRHLMDRVAHQAGPGVVDSEVAELRIDLQDIALEHLGEPPRLGAPRGDPPAPEQPIAVDDAVIVTGAPRVADAAAVTDRIGEPVAERLGGDDVSRNGK